MLKHVWENDDFIYVQRLNEQGHIVSVFRFSKQLGLNEEYNSYVDIADEQALRTCNNADSSNVIGV